jgi:cardiolipin synthase
VRIFEYSAAMMHAKTLVADGIWSAVGTNNFDNRSMAFNDETLLMVHDAPFGACLEEVFCRDLRYADEITLERFRQRPWYDRILETGASTLSRIL